MVDSTAYRFSHQLRVRYSEIDGQKMVFNSHYLTYIDVAVVEYFREILGENWLALAEQHLFDIALVKITLNFVKPARLDDLLRVHCRIENLGNSSFTLSAIITRGGDETVLSAEAVYVNYNAAQGKAQPIPSDIREKLAEFEGRTL